MTEIKLHLYGAFRQLGSDEITLSIQKDSTLASLKGSLKNYVQISKSNISDDLIDSSVFATDENILKNDDLVGQHASLAVLPPVCGG